MELNKHKTTSDEINYFFEYREALIKEIYIKKHKPIPTHVAFSLDYPLILNWLTILQIDFTNFCPVKYVYNRDTYKNDICALYNEILSSEYPSVDSCKYNYNNKISIPDVNIELDNELYLTNRDFDILEEFLNRQSAIICNCLSDARQLKHTKEYKRIKKLLNRTTKLTSSYFHLWGFFRESFI